MRRSISGVLLLMTVAFQTEPVFGEVRDGDVHHEDVAESWVHAQDPHRSHSLDASTESGNVPIESDAETSEHHEHGGSMDHCTHLHGFALVNPTDVGFVLGECSYELALEPEPTDARSGVLAPPPRV